MATTGRHVRSTKPIVEDDLLLEEVVIERFDSDPTRIIKPLFDVVWNASGFPASMNFKDGEWVVRR